MKKQRLEQKPQISSCTTKSSSQKSQDSLKVPMTPSRLCDNALRTASVCENTQKATDAYCKSKRRSRVHSGYPHEWSIGKRRYVWNQQSWRQKPFLHGTDSSWTLNILVFLSLLYREIRSNTVSMKEDYTVKKIYTKTLICLRDSNVES